MVSFCGGSFLLSVFFALICVSFINVDHRDEMDISVFFRGYEQQ